MTPTHYTKTLITLGAVSTNVEFRSQKFLDFFKHFHRQLDNVCYLRDSNMFRLGNSQI